MTILEKDIKLLWGRACGRCSYCNIDLTLNLENSGDIIIGEMAHVIARKKNGPRGSENIDEDLLNTYSNLILLCNNHHEMIDKAPLDFSIEQILGWKRKHEEIVGKSLEGDLFNSKEDLLSALKRLLIENRSIFDQFGPESFVARRNPISKVKEIWDLRKLSTLIPNNKKIINLIERNPSLFSDEEFSIFLRFKSHASSFENNAYERMDNESVSTFPIEFSEMIFRGGI